MSLIIAVPRERRTSERRVALDPSRVERLMQNGITVRIEEECGHAASFHDEDYTGSPVAESFADVVAGVDVVVKVVCPTLDEISMLPEGCLLLCMMSAFQHLEEVAALRKRKITVLAMDHLPRTTRAQPMDALSSQATVAGYKAALLAAELSPRLFPMLTTAAGTIRPSRVLVIGAGVAGLQAIATSKRLGAQVEAYDIRRAAKEQIESVGARMIDTGVEVEGAGGFARALRKDEKQKQHDVLAKHLARAHVVICAASIPGRHAPRIITEDMVDGMLPESVIVDMAASTGGNCELTRIGEHYYHHETLIVGPLNLPSHGAVHASEMYARNVHNMLELVIDKGEVALDPEDEIIARCVLLHDGHIHHASTAKLFDEESVPFGGFRHGARELPDQTSGWLNDEAVADDEDSTQDTRSAVPENASKAASKKNLEPTVTNADSDVQQAANSRRPHSGDNNNAGNTDAKASMTDNAQWGAVAADTTDEQTALSEHGPADFLQDEQALEDLAKLDGVDPQTVGADSAAPGDDDPEDFATDDLTRIDGVGPALQERLFSFGYRRWQHLAELDELSTEKLAVQLELEDEIKNQDWSGQAQRLLETES